MPTEPTFAPPDGFVLDGAPPQMPEGFVLDQRAGPPTGITMTGRIGGPAASMVAVRNMMRLLSPRFGGAQPAQQGNGPPVETSSALPGGGGQEISTSSRGSPEAMDTSYAGSVPNWISAAASLAVKPEDELALYRQYSPNPNWRWGRIGGNVVYADESGRVHRAVAPVSEATGIGDAIMRTGQWAGSGFGPALPQMAGAGAGMVPTGPVGQSLAAAGGAGITDFARQQVVNAMLRRSPMNVDAGNIAGQSALAAGSQLAGNLLARNLETNRLGITGAVDRAAITNPANIAQWRQLQQQAQALNIPLRADQIADLPSMRQTARQLIREPGSTNQMQLFQRAQQGEAVPNALAQEIPAITPGPGGGAGAFVEGARDTLRQAQVARTAASSPHYQAAVGDTVQPGSVTANYRPNAASFDEGSPIAARINFYADRIEGARNGAQLDGIYREIRDEAARVARDDPTLAHHLGNLRDALDAQLTGAPGIPAISPNIAAGRQAHTAASPPINEMNRGVIGMTRDLVSQPVMVQREGVASILSRGNAEEIRTARAAFERAGNLDAWNAGAQDWLRGAANSAQRVRIEGNMPGNVSGRFLQDVAPTPLQGQATVEMLGGQATPEAARFGRLADVLQAASRSVQEGSPTVTDALGRGRFAGPVARAISAALQSVSPSRLSTMITEGSIRRNAPAMAEAYTSADPMALIQSGVLSPRQFLAARLGGQSAPVTANMLLQAWQRGYLPNVPVGAGAQ